MINDFTINTSCPPNILPDSDKIGVGVTNLPGGEMNFLLGIAAIVCCLILSTFNVFLSSPIHNVALWGIVISVVYMLLSAFERKKVI